MKSIAIPQPLFSNSLYFQPKKYQENLEHDSKKLKDIDARNYKGIYFYDKEKET